MKEEVKKFVDEYNKRMDWNQDILNGFGPDLTKSLENNEFIRHKLTTDKITEEGFDLENADVYEFERTSDGKNVNELQVFNNKTCGTSYFWVATDETEQEYKAKTTESIYNNVTKTISELENKIVELTNERDELMKIKWGVLKVIWFN
jgi:hypothetical protein